MNSDTQETLFGLQGQDSFLRQRHKEGCREAPQKTVRSGSNIETWFKVAYRWKNMKPLIIMVLYMCFTHLNDSVGFFLIVFRIRDLDLDLVIY